MPITSLFNVIGRFKAYLIHNPQPEWLGIVLGYIPMHEVAPSAVSTAVITDAMICSVHFNVSFFVILYPPFRLLGSTSLSPCRAPLSCPLEPPSCPLEPPFCHFERSRALELCSLATGGTQEIS